MGTAGGSRDTLSLPSEYNELIIWFKCNSNNGFSQIYHVPTTKFLNQGNNYITVGNYGHWLFVGFNINVGTGSLTCNNVLLGDTVDTCTVYIWYR